MRLGDMAFSKILEVCDSHMFQLPATCDCLFKEDYLEC